MSDTHKYSKYFYQHHKDLSLNSAKVIVPLVMDMINPKSVIDLGCGLGAFLRIFQENGVEKILGLDGNYVKRENLLISPEKFLARDLKEKIHLDEKFDLVVCLEVAEHLPEKCTEDFIESLTSLGPVVLFSAAVPHQGGENHINEQWPPYWIEKFAKRGYLLVDALRNELWDNEKVAFWFAQNSFIFVDQTRINNYPKLNEALNKNPLPNLSVVHPAMYLKMFENKDFKNTLKKALNFFK